jgi:hypothetical protein
VGFVANGLSQLPIYAGFRVVFHSRPYLHKIHIHQSFEQDKKTNKKKKKVQMKRKEKHLHQVVIVVIITHQLVAAVMPISFAVVSKHTSS